MFTDQASEAGESSAFSMAGQEWQDGFSDSASLRSWFNVQDAQPPASEPAKAEPAKATATSEPATTEPAKAGPSLDTNHLQRRTLGKEFGKPQTRTCGGKYIK